MLLKLFLFFLKLGFISFGGGYPMMTFIMQDGNRVLGLTAQEFADMTALELLASGPIAINAATYIGYIKSGILGATVATIGICLPSIIISVIVYKFVTTFNDNVYLQHFISAIKIACGGVLITTAITLAQNILIYSGNGQTFSISSISWVGVLIVVVCGVAIKKFDVNPIYMVLVSAVIGVVAL